MKGNTILVIGGVKTSNAFTLVTIPPSLSIGYSFTISAENFGETIPNSHDIPAVAT